MERFMPVFSPTVTALKSAFGGELKVGSQVSRDLSLETKNMDLAGAVSIRTDRIAGSVALLMPPEVVGIVREKMFGAESANSAAGGKQALETLTLSLCEEVKAGLLAAGQQAVDVLWDLGGLQHRQTTIDGVAGDVGIRVPFETARGTFVVEWLLKSR